MTERIQIGVSACLLGEEVRYDGGHKCNDYINHTLADYFDFVSYCPEMASGLGVPRPTIRLISRNGQTRLVDGKNADIDHTDTMLEASTAYCKKLPRISGYILKSRSPSCGMERVNLFNEKDMPGKTGVGIFAGQLMHHFPDLPVEEEGRLNDSRLRENFIERVFVYHRWQDMLDKGLSAAALIEFHKVHKLILLAHDETSYRIMGPMIADAGQQDLESLAKDYVSMLMKALRKLATPKKHMNVLQHVMGYLKKNISREDKQELLDILEQYRLGQLPLIVPVTLLNHHLRIHPAPYISEQLYMNPYPQELMLRNHV